MSNIKYTINHIMSRNIESGIFSALMRYFKDQSPKWVSHVESIEPLAIADIFHYHRPHLEKNLKSHSVCTVHHDLDDPDIWHARERFIPRYNEASAVICLNETQKKILGKDEGIAMEKLFVVPHGYNDDFLRPVKKARVDTEKFALGIASRRYGRRVKGEAYLLELVKRLDPTIIKFILVGEDRSIDAVALRRYGFEAEVFERLPYRVFQGFYSKINALLMCSSHEGGPANIPEALGTGTPVFSTPIGMSLDFIKPGENGFFLSLDPDSDSDLIMQYVTSLALVQKLEEKCIERTHAVPTWKASVLGNLHVYSKILELDILKPTEENIEETNKSSDNETMLSSENEYE